jgi:spore germination cell wall hydrolase CwlJ-like protein
MRYKKYIFYIFLISNVYANTENEIIFDCDKNRTNPIICTACNIYHESRGENIVGQIAVALVTKNRVKARMYPNTYCEVVWETRRDAKSKRKVPMFTWTHDGKRDKIYNKTRWKLALEIAKQTIDGEIQDFTAGALWFHTTNVTPYWKKSYHHTLTVGSHAFYTVDEDMFLDNIIRNNLSKKRVNELLELYNIDN